LRSLLEREPLLRLPAAHLAVNLDRSGWRRIDERLGRQRMTVLVVDAIERLPLLRSGAWRPPRLPRRFASAEVVRRPTRSDGAGGAASSRCGDHSPPSVSSRPRENAAPPIAFASSTTPWKSSFTPDRIGSPGKP